jgi:two-component system sensor histidine kinase HydH
MPIKPIRKKSIGIYSPPWMIVGAVVILLAIVVVLAVQNINREKRYMSKILSEKGAALIKAFEAGARTGMMGMMWGGDQVQNLLEETARQPGIFYLTVTDSTGLILAHNNRLRIGQRFFSEDLVKSLGPTTVERWRLTDYEGDRRSFEVYRYFQPLENSDRTARPGRRSEMCGQRRMMGCGDDWCFPSRGDGSKKIIFIGLDVAPFEDGRKEDIRNTIIISAVLLILGFGGFFSMFLAQSYRSTRRQLRDTSAFADEVVTKLPVGLVATGRDGRIAFFNETAEKITGLSFSDVRGKNPNEVLHSQWCDLGAFLSQGQRVLEQEIECTFTYGKTVPLSVSASEIVNDRGDFVGSILILRDLGEVRRLQEEIRRKEKLAALGGLAAGVAHEIRNPLSSIKGLASFFGNKFAEGSEDREAASVMIREVDRLNRVISELLDFARPSELKQKPTDVNKLLEHSVRLVEQDAKTKNIKINLLKGSALPFALLDPDRFSQCLLNLYLNAIQAMDEGGNLLVRSSVTEDDKIKVEIEDTGKGMDQEDLNKIFDPYFTTKSSGTGLGLAIVHKIIEAHQASIRAKSTSGKGTVFTIEIPIQPEKNDDRGDHESK